MTIYKLTTGSSNTVDTVKNGKYNFYDRSSKIKKSNKYILEGEYTIVPGEGNFEPKYANGKFDLHQRAYAVSSSFFVPKYFFYFIHKNRETFFKYSLGSTVASLRASSFEWINKIKIIPKMDQQQIIDIIEPHEKLFLKYNNCIRIDNPKNTKNDLNWLVKTLNPIDNLEHKVDQIKEIIDKTINFSLHNILGKEEFKLSEILSISSSKSENLISYGVGKNGLFKNDSKAKKLKRVDPFSICVGFVRTNNIDIGINGSKKDIGISAAYKVMDSNKSPILAYFIYKLIKNNYLKWSVSSSRGTGTINMKKLLNENVYLDIKKIEESKTYFKKLILLGETANKQKKKLVDIKKALINNLNYDVNQTLKIDF